MECQSCLVNAISNRVSWSTLGSSWMVPAWEGMGSTGVHIIVPQVHTSSAAKRLGLSTNKWLEPLVASVFHMLFYCCLEVGQVHQVHLEDPDWCLLRWPGSSEEWESEVTAFYNSRIKPKRQRMQAIDTLRTPRPPERTGRLACVYWASERVTLQILVTAARKSQRTSYLHIIQIEFLFCN